MAAESIFRKDTEFLNLITRHISKQTGKDLPIHIARLDFGFDPGEVAGLRPANFLLERRITVPYTENRFISEAPLATDDHIALLESLERLLL